MEILQQGSPPLLCYVHLILQVLYKGHRIGLKSQRQESNQSHSHHSRGSKSKKLTFTPSIAAALSPISIQLPINTIPFPYLQEGSRYLPLCHSCLHAQLSMTGFQSQPPAEPAGIQTVWAEQEGQKERGL